jgi:peptide/nickel transport system substrate-binding protein
VIRTRNYEALLFGQIIGQNPDLYAFWHSSERLDPGLNVALYTNSEADTLLEDARQLTDVSQRNEKYQEFEEILKKEHPAVFLYAPKFIYVVPKNLGGINLGSVSIASDRFRDISNWYLETDHVWKFFTKEDPVGEAE